MKKTEREFLELLEERARRESRLIKSGILPSWAGFVGDWLGVHPWRALIPVSVILYFIARVVVGERFVEIVLSIYGGFRG